MDNNEHDEELLDLGSVTKDTKGPFPYGFMWDGGLGYYYPGMV